MDEGQTVGGGEWLLSGSSYQDEGPLYTGSRRGGSLDIKSRLCRSSYFSSVHVLFLGKELPFGLTD